MTTRMNFNSVSLYEQEFDKNMEGGGKIARALGLQKAQQTVLSSRSKFSTHRKDTSVGIRATSQRVINNIVADPQFTAASKCRVLVSEATLVFLSNVITLTINDVIHNEMTTPIKIINDYNDATDKYKIYNEHYVNGSSSIPTAETTATSQLQDLREKKADAVKLAENAKKEGKWESFVSSTNLAASLEADIKIFENSQASGKTIQVVPRLYGAYANLMGYISKMTDFNSVILEKIHKARNINFFDFKQTGLTYESAKQSILNTPLPHNSKAIEKLYKADIKNGLTISAEGALNIKEDTESDSTGKLTVSGSPSGVTLPVQSKLQVKKLEANGTNTEAFIKSNTTKGNLLECIYVGDKKIRKGIIAGIAYADKETSVVILYENVKGFLSKNDLNKVEVVIENLCSADTLGTTYIRGIIQ